MSQAEDMVNFGTMPGVFLVFFPEPVIKEPEMMDGYGSGLSSSGFFHTKPVSCFLNK
jgi:hypothetical protein